MGDWISGSVVQWISGSVRDVCMSHQSDWIFPVVKANGMREDLIPIQLRTAIFILQ